MNIYGTAGADGAPGTNGAAGYYRYFPQTHSSHLLRAGNGGPDGNGYAGGVGVISPPLQPGIRLG